MTTTDFLPTVDSEIATLQSFCTLLEREQQLLGKGEIDALPQLVQEKNELAAALAAVAKQRATALAATGLAADRAGIAAWFAAHPTATRARTDWSLLLSLATQARELNRVNGELIQLRMQHNSLALEALLGVTNTLGLYGSDGQSSLPSGRRISDRA